MPPTLANVARAANHMDAANVDALVSWSPASVRCLTGYWCWLAPLFREFMVSPGGSGELVQRNIALLPRSGDLCLVLEPMWALNTSATWVQDIRVAGGSQFVADADGCEPERVEALSDEIRAQTIARAVQKPVAQDPFEVLAQALRDRGMDAGRIGVEMDGACAADREALRRALPSAQLLDCSNLLRLVRAQKTAGEIAALEHAAAVSEFAFVDSVAAADPRGTVAPILAGFRARLADGGADFDHFAIAPAGLGFSTAGNWVLAGESMYLDFGCICDGWFSDSGTTLCAGAPSDQALADHQIALECVQAGADAIRPGVRSSEVQRQMAGVLAEAGIEGPFPHGHGLGREVRDYPLIVPASGGKIADDCVEVDADLPLEENMVINLEAPLLRPGVRSTHCERTFVVTATGCRPLVPQERRAPMVVGASTAAAA